MICPYCFYNDAFKLHKADGYHPHCWDCIRHCKACVRELDIELYGRWIPLESHWERLEAFAEEHKRKTNLREYRNYNDDYYLVGKAGEVVFGEVYGEKVDWRVYKKRDVGDFWGGFLDVKSTQYWRDPHLKEYNSKLHGGKERTILWVLAGIHLQHKRGRLFGAATREMMLKAKLEDYGYGKRRSLERHELLPLDIIKEYRQIIWEMMSRAERARSRDG